MKKLLVIVLALVMVMGFAGCIKPEESPIYTNGNDEPLKETAAPAGKYQAPEHWTDSVEKDDLAVIVDANVIVPDVSLFPALVCKTGDGISQEMADSIMNALLGDTVLNKSRTNVDTKADVQSIIDSMNDMLADPTEAFAGAEITAGTPEAEAYIKRVEEQKKYLEDVIKDLPETFEDGPADTQFHHRIPERLSEEWARPLEDGKQKIEGEVTLDDGRQAFLLIEKRGFVNYGLFGQQYTIERSYSSSDPKEYGVPIVDAEKTIEEAKAEATETLRAMGIDYLDVSYVEEQYIIERDEAQMPTAVRPCYKFYFTHNIGGILENYAIARDIPLADDQNYGYIGAEVAEMIIADEGLLSFVWGSPINISATHNENVDLLKFEDVQSVFNKQIIMDNLQSETDALVGMYDLDVLSRKITITEARLGFMSVHWQGHEGEYLMIPVWDFYGYESLKLADPDDARNKQISVNESGEYVSDESAPKSYLTLNAVDGSVINRNTGY